MLPVLDESFLESAIRWHLYRRWKRRPSRRRKAEYEFYLLMRSLPKNSIVVDCGANVGDVVAVARNYGMRVIAFEPDEDALAVLRSRFQEDEKVSIIAKAVGGYGRKAKFFQRPEVAAGKLNFTQASSLLRTVDEEMLTRTVDVVDIVEFLQKLDEPVAVLKMDIEGAEIECLEAMLDAGIVGSIGKILVETHETLSTEMASKTDSLRCRITSEGHNNIDLSWM